MCVSVDYFREISINIVFYVAAILCNVSCVIALFMRVGVVFWYIYRSENKQWNTPETIKNRLNVLFWRDWKQTLKICVCDWLWHLGSTNRPLSLLLTSRMYQFFKLVQKILEQQYLYILKWDEALSTSLERFCSDLKEH